MSFPSSFRPFKAAFRLTLLSTALFSPSLFAAVVPAGVVLSEKQELNFHLTAEVTTFDPHKIEGSSDVLIIRQLFDTLVNTDELGNLLPGAAVSWSSSADHKTWTFQLRKEAKWSNGEPVTAHDFVYAWRRLADPKTAAPNSSYLSYMKLANIDDIIAGKQPTEALGVKAVDDYTLELTLSAAVPYISELVQHPLLVPVPKATIEQFGDKWTQPENMVNNGSYRLTSRVLNEKSEFERNKAYWNDKETVINKATIHILGAPAAIGRYRTGELDMSAVPETLYRDKKFRAEYDPQILNSPKLVTFTYQMNMRKPPLDDIRVRKALDLALDRQIITDKVLGFGQKPTFTFTPNTIRGGEKIQQPEYASWTQEQRNAEAQKLLIEAGYSKDNPVKTELLYNTNEGLKNIALAASSMWKKNLAGMADISMRNMEWKTYLDARARGDFSISFLGWGADYNEASSFLTVYLSNNENNQSAFKSERYEQLIESSYAAQTDDERAEIYAQAEAELGRHHPFIAIYNYTGLAVKKPKLKGYEGKNPQGMYYFKDFYFEK